MTTKQKAKQGTVEKRKFTVDPNFVDPLLDIKERDEKLDKFDEIEVEEIPYYYAVHLGIPINSEE